MKKLLAVAVLLLTAITGLSQGVRLQAFTTNAGPTVTNIVLSLSSNLQPNRLRGTNALTGAVRIWAATSGTNGFWLDPATITPGAATNVAWPVRGSNTVLTTNGFEVTINAITDTNVVNTLASNIIGGSFISAANGTGYNTSLTNLLATTNAAGLEPALLVNGSSTFWGNVIVEGTGFISAQLIGGGMFTGVGSGLTGLIADNISGGTLHPARMATNTPFAGAFLKSTSPSTAAWSKDGSTLTNITGNAGGATNLLNASGEVVIYGNSMEMRDPNTGWTNVNWSDQTLSTQNTNVLDWFNQRLIGPWQADRISGNGRGLTNIATPWVTISSKSVLRGTATIRNDGMDYGPDTPGTTTGGWQEAIDSFPRGSSNNPAGVYLKPSIGAHFYTNTIVYSNNWPYQFVVQGAGKFATKWVSAIANSGTTNFIILAGGGNASPALNCSGDIIFQDLTFASVYCSTNIILRATNYNSMVIQRANFSSWDATSGADWMSSVASYQDSLNYATTTNGLIGLVSGNVNNKGLILDDVQFGFLACGVETFDDHIKIRDFISVINGQNSGFQDQTAWPTSSHYRLGAAIIRWPKLDTSYEGVHFYSDRLGIALMNHPGSASDPQYVVRPQLEGGYAFAAINTNGNTWAIDDVTLASSALNTALRINTNDFSQINNASVSTRSIVYNDSAALIRPTVAGGIVINSGRADGNGGGLTNLVVTRTTNLVNYGTSLTLGSYPTTITNATKGAAIIFGPNPDTDPVVSVWAGGVEVIRFGENLGNYSYAPGGIYAYEFIAHTGSFVGNGNGLTNIQEVALNWWGTNPPANQILGSTSSNTPAWFTAAQLGITGGGGGSGIETNGGSGIGNVLSNLTVTASEGAEVPLYIRAAPGSALRPIILVTNHGAAGKIFMELDINGHLTVDGSGITNIYERALHASLANPDAGSVLISTSSNTPAWSSNVTVASITGDAFGDASGMTNYMSTNLVASFKSPFYTDYSVVYTDEILACTGTNQLLTLPNPANKAGRYFVFLMSSTTGYGSAIITNHNGSTTILTAAALSQTITNGQSLTVISDGTNWR